MPVIGINQVTERLRSTRSSLKFRGGRLVAARAPERLVEGGKDALGGLIPVFLDHVKLFKGKQPVRLNFRRADLEDGDTLSPRALYLPQS